MQLPDGYEDDLDLISDAFVALTAPNATEDEKEAATVRLGRTCRPLAKALAK